MRRRRLRAAAMLPLAISLTGCPDLSQVQQLAKTADGAKSGMDTLAGDFALSCDRQNLLINLPPGPPPDPPPTKACTDRDELDHLGKNLLVEQAVLLAYFDALGRLASADAKEFEKEAPSLKTSFKNAGLTSTQQDMAGAAGGLAAAISKLSTWRYREKEIADLLSRENDHVKTLTGGLSDEVAPAIASPDAPCGTRAAQGTAPSYLMLLCNEFDAVDSFFSVPSAAEKDAGVRVLLRLQYQSALDQLHSREKAAFAYRTAMLNLATAHDKLLSASKKGFDRAAVKALASQLSGSVSDIAGAVETLQKDAR